MDTQQYWDDMNRDNDLQIDDGYTVLRFPSWLVRHHPEYVAGRIRRAIQNASAQRIG
jgi:very-short-patch-repair endonuclease